MAMNCAVILTKRIDDLEASNENLKQKRAGSKRQIAYKEDLSVLEHCDPKSGSNRALEGESVTLFRPAQGASQPTLRAPPTCTNCHELRHRRNQCSKPCHL